MLDTLAPALRATLVGPIAARALRAGARGEVRAVFDRSFYVSLDGGWICAGPASLGAGPLNLLCEPWPTRQPLNAILQVGDAAHIENGILRSGRTTIPLAAAQTWHPRPPDAWSRTSLARGLAAFAAALPAILPEEGLAQLLRPGEPSSATASSPVMAAAQAPARYLAQFLEAADDGIRAIDPAQIVPLIGLGPGLTPSGDDYLGGTLVALALTGRISLRDQLWQALEPNLADRTGNVSRAHLAAASEGYGSAALHDLLGVILTARTEAIPATLAAVAAIGHTSGWDALAGAIAICVSLSPLALGPSTGACGPPRF